MENEQKKRGRPAKTSSSAIKQPVENETSLEVIPAPRAELVLEGDPMAQLEYAKKAADALMTVVSRKPKPVIINNQTYLEYGDWQTLARFFGCTVGVEWTKPIEKGWESRAVVYRDGQVISAAEAMCTREERNWARRDEFMLRSMAQTRASAKALRNAVGWVAELAGYSATPAEEMDGVRAEKERMPPYEVRKVAYPKYDETNDARGLDEEESTTDMKQTIKDLLEQLNEPPMPSAVKRLTGIDMKNGVKDLPENYPKIIAKLEEIINA